MKNFYYHPTHRYSYDEPFYVAGISRHGILEQYDKDDERYEEIKAKVEDLTDNEMRSIADDLWDYIIDGYYERLKDLFERRIKL